MKNLDMEYASHPTRPRYNWVVLTWGVSLFLYAVGWLALYLRLFGPPYDFVPLHFMTAGLLASVPAMIIALGTVLVYPRSGLPWILLIIGVLIFGALALTWLALGMAAAVF